MITIDKDAWQPKITNCPQDLKRCEDWNNKLDEAIESAKRLYLRPTLVKIIGDYPICWN